ncbi:Phosphatidylinositol synthase [Operophtera brumata]|uniref:Phosphatidylinositol synthase n=1 Tax=Operophtera brumata TaxID=104452 RepID=A0A0L7K262_OPEBR|nr:Phosphatidylinositol synthase [Operophtera brumata]
MAEELENIFLFVPNLIGFGRVILAIISFYFMPTHCTLACTCYITSALLDAFDGHAARYFNQIVKAGISVIHGIVASMNLATIDIKERAAIAAKQE